MAAKKTVTKADLVDQVAAAAGLKKKDAKAAIDAFLAKVEEALAAGNKVQLTGFGTFEVRKRKARTGVKPGTKEKIKIPATQYPAFKPGKALKDKVKK
ncbi:MULTISPECIES: HU family DNA-binding protein [Thermus]|jgi:DNA-binding protein HU-beta|uniref:DNA-binding protein HU n=2 Tax=Thermus aquaticus TaxID=271 RepID=A0A0M9ADC6_THEAQ|nr:MULTISPECIES: HU family DNA-binding protein [Thermus]ALJ91745.1 DNA-binding protein HBsu [Thermus aquaticus Y51MC23]KOX89098.1 DNA-binding protein HU [Thermus aquaticus]MDT7909429.1 HU family DNA-binding protein [Thermus sp.]MDT7922045.1 HU family DNA-binding protein [Thermus sp.]